MQERLGAPAGDIAFTGWRRQKQLHRGIGVLHGMSKPTIAAVNGAAAGLGCDLALACDFIIASEGASFIMSFILRGLVPDGGGLYFLPRRVLGCRAPRNSCSAGGAYQRKKPCRLALLIA